MANSQDVTKDLSLTEDVIPKQLAEGMSLDAQKFTFKKLRGGFLLVLGYLLSPLCWWNDLIFNLPVAYFFGYICSWFSPNLFFPSAIAGYWLSNIVGILLMQAGVVQVFAQKQQKYNFKKEIFMGVLTSTAYTLIILTLIQLKILDTPDLFSGGQNFSLSAFLPWRA